MTICVTAFLFPLYHVNACTLTHLTPRRAFHPSSCVYMCKGRLIVQMWYIEKPEHSGNSLTGCVTTTTHQLACFCKASSLLLSFVRNTLPLLTCLKARNRKSQFFSKTLSLKSWVSMLEEEQMCVRIFPRGYFVSIAESCDRPVRVGSSDRERVWSF